MRRRTTPHIAVESLEPRTLLSVQLAADVNTDTFSSNPIDFVTLGNQGLFFAAQADGLYALWRTDGTAAGTTLVKGGFAAKPLVPESTFHPVVAGDKVYFQYVSSAASGPIQLWVTDGTTDGTRPLADVKPGYFTFSPYTNYVAFAGRVFFNATDANGIELWSTDGTPAGTSMFMDVAPGATSANVRGLTVAGPYLFFETTENGLMDLWRTDGTQQNTVRLAQFTFTAPPEIVAHQDKVYVAATPPGEYPDQIWESDGTVQGTRLFKDISPANNVPVGNLTVMGGNLYFTAATGASSTATLWRSDFTPEGTAPVLPNPPTGFNPYPLAAGTDQLFFYANDPTAGRELWRSDGTATGTYRLADIRPGTASSVPQAMFKPLVTARGAYFFADDGTSGAELYFADGGAAPGSTYRVKDIYPGSTSSFDTHVGFQGAMLPDGRLLLDADDPAVGFEPQVSDATAAGTHPIVDINTLTMSSFPAELIDAGGVPLVGARPPNDLRPSPLQFTRALFRIAPDGGAPTYLSAAAPDTDESQNGPVTGRGRYEYVTFKGYTYFYNAFAGTNNHLYRTDGTPAGTQSFLSFNRSWPEDTFATRRYRHLAVVGDRLYFTGPDNAAGSGLALYRTDGTPQGTEEVFHAPVRITDLIAGPDGQTLYFSPDTKLAKIGNGAAAADVFAETGQQVLHLGFAGTRLVFSSLATGANFLGFSDGSSNNVTLFTGINVSSDFTVFKNKVYFLTGSTLAESDGTAAGTRSVWANGVEGRSVTGWNRTAIGDYLYFVGSDSAHGSEWWRTDGTDAGTNLFADVVPGSGGSDPTVQTGQADVARSIATWRGSIYFTAQTPGEGAELWRAGASGGGTPELVANLDPGPTGSDPTSLTVIGDQLYFIATRPDVGREVFKVVDDVAPRVVDAAFEPSGLNGGGSIRLHLSEGVTLGTGSAPTLQRQGGGPAQAITPALTSTYDAATNTLTITPGSPLPDGDYRLSIPAAWLTDAAGNPLGSDFMFDFFVLNGDANRDRAVDFNDLVILAQHYNSTGNKLWSDGDFTGDGNVDFDDLVILAQRYNTTLPAPIASPVPAATPVKPKAAKPVFSVTPVSKAKSIKRVPAAAGITIDR
ncbi:MAG TPA: ELWxxDGT repeat protein [Tepidisphaeraceae bacterium]